MDDGGQHENGRHKTDSYRGSLYPWNMMPQHQGKEQQNALAKNKKIMSILAEREAAIRERNLALTEKKEALAARDAALAQRDKALAERDEALMERDNALASLQYRESSINFPTRMHHPPNHPADMVDISNYMGGVHVHITDAFPISSISSEAAKSCNKRKRPKESKTGLSKSPRKAKTIGEDLNKHVIPEGKKYRTEWDSQDVGLNLIAFDESIMPGPVCSCTGVPHQCYKWGNGGWQSSCCTTTMSQYPLPQMQNKRHTRVGGRKMSGSVFARLISRLAADGHDLLVPVDLKDYWARHGTNRYITIK